MIKRLFLFLSAKILWVQTVIILTIVYFLVLGPVAILAKIFDRDFLKSKPQKGTFWQKRKSFSLNLEEARKQY